MTRTKAAIVVKQNIPHKIFDFISDLVAVEINTSKRKIIIAALYQPPTRTYIPIPDFIQLFRQNCPVYLLADLNSNHPKVGYRHTNTSGSNIYRLIKTEHCSTQDLTSRPTLHTTLQLLLTLSSLTSEHTTTLT